MKTNYKVAIVGATRISWKNRIKSIRRKKLSTC